MEFGQELRLHRHQLLCAALPLLLLFCQDSIRFDKIADVRCGQKRLILFLELDYDLTTHGFTRDTEQPIHVWFNEN